MKIVLKHVTKIFVSRHKKDELVTAVDDFDFEIPDGKLIGLLGPSGCGKSTTLNLICGLEEPTEGRIFFGDEDITDLAPEDRGVGMVFQNYALYPHLSVRANISFPLENLRGKDKLTKQQIDEKVYETAKLVQIEELLDRRPSELSGGQQQRVAIARALVKTPGVLLLDEPLSNLDARLRLQTREQIRRIQKETGITTIFVTHDQEEAMSICDEILVMKFGEKQQMDPPQEVYNNPANLFVAQFLGTPPVNVFRGRADGHKVIVGEDVIFEAKEDLGAKDIWVAIRPEGFTIGKAGEALTLKAENEQIQVMGRDISIVCKNPNCTKETFKIIVAQENLTTDKEIYLHVKPSKLFLFDGETEERIRIEQ